MKPIKRTHVSNLLFPRTIEELFHQFWDDAKTEPTWAPTVDVRETEGAYVITAELPGVDANDVELTATAEGLTLEGEKKLDPDVDEKRGHLEERIYGEFSRSFAFPVPISPDHIVAQARRGILTITVQKAEAEKTRRIDIVTE
jgi:HSP20 family protein